jgi:D-alanyl-D-alanine carboxypeptidase (penicillin-binding protein 5/6)
MDEQTGYVLASKNPDERIPMASTTKIMTGLLVLEHSKKPKDLQKVVVAKKDATEVGEDSIYLSVGEKLTVDQLLKAVLIQSANDASVDLADYVAGSQDKFVALMNKRAAELGLKNTHYMNPHGLDEPNHYSSAMDLTSLGRLAMQDNRFRGYVKNVTARIPWRGHPNARVLASHNTLLARYPWIDGIKTGWTDKAGYCIVSSGTYGGRRFIVTVLGDPTDKARQADALKLYQYASSLYEKRQLGQADVALAHVDVPFHDEGMDLETVQPVSTVARTGAELSAAVDAPPSVSLPVSEGEKLGTVTYFVDGVETAHQDLVATRGFDSADFGTRAGYRAHRLWEWLGTVF